MSLRSIREAGRVAGDGSGVEVPGPSGGRGRERVYPGVDPRASDSQPAGAVAEVVPSLELGSEQRRGVRYGLPRATADAGARRTYQAAAGKRNACQSAGRTAKTAGPGH